MTASIQNSWSAFKVLKNGLKWFREATHETPEYRVWMLETLVDSIQKCLASLEAQIRFYQSAKGVGRAYWIVQPDGTEEHVSGQQLQTLVLELPNADLDAVIHGKPEALAAVAAALAVAGHSTHGPANLHDIAAVRGESAFHSAKAPPTGESTDGKPD
ncbi:hypothetical protein FIV06_24050 [Labrenzia sp. THAF191b]|uniref:hypothetical protein n=1 Tax=unclassified Labrenzia TaxID=2648686 RepID=UPI001267EC9D|nr:MULTISPECIES: hypothetical protein [unclassified Labrenzia]QFT00523.1 hypothetical protein FIV06_24050 [Labrenzia sp. THAF191b]QFT06836.1 hypothetical protein FIV05_24045 [Labrenzia sp. THAF191a]QFT18380.1 hypothetical protein FIV03_24060 [Labrenzia sp. THAF187b]